jgi:predicted transcriptional regulator
LRAFSLSLLRHRRSTEVDVRSNFCAKLSDINREKLVDTLKDIWASLVAGVQERTTNPLTFSFIASWCLWNFKFLLIITGDGTTAERIQRFEQLYPHTASTYLQHAFGAPLITALTYVFVYPYISELVISYSRTRQVRIANAIKKIEGARVLTADEARDLVRRHEHDRASWEEKEAKLQSQLKQLRDVITSDEATLSKIAPLKETLRQGTEQHVWVSATGTNSVSSDEAKGGALASPVVGFNPNYSRQAAEVISALAAVSRSLGTGDIALRSNMSNSAVVVAIEELAGHGLVEKTVNNKWKLTTSGHRVAAISN